MPAGQEPQVMVTQIIHESGNAAVTDEKNAFRSVENDFPWKRYAE